MFNPEEVAEKDASCSTVFSFTIVREPIQPFDTLSMAHRRIEHACTIYYDINVQKAVGGDYWKQSLFELAKIQVVIISEASTWIPDSPSAERMLVPDSSKMRTRVVKSRLAATSSSSITTITIHLTASYRGSDSRLPLHHKSYHTGASSNAQIRMQTDNPRLLSDSGSQM